MKICIIATHYLPHIGGLELATNHLANELTQLGHEVHIITPQASVATDKAIDTAIVHRFPIPGYPEGNTLLVLLKEQPGHGYSLLSELNGLDITTIHPSVVYRTLREMEAL